MNRVEGLKGLFMNRPMDDPSGTPDQADVYDEAVRWFMALRPSVDGTPIRGDRRAFEQWLAADPAHARAFAQCRTDWEGLEPLASVYGPQTGSMGETIVSPFRPAANWKWLAGMAAVLAAVVTMAIFAVAWFQPTFEVAAETPAAEHKILALIDGSRIELNGRSRVRVEYYRQRRVSHLDEGEALFDVIGDSDRPFTVEAGIGAVRVMGTSFQVTREADHLTVVVLRGQVRVERHTSPKMAVALSAGQRVNVTATGMEPVGAVAIETVGTWRQNVLVFDRSPLRDVVAAMRRQYPGTIQLDAAAADIPLTAVVQLADIDTTLAALSSSLPVQIDHPAPTHWHVRSIVR